MNGVSTKGFMAASSIWLDPKLLFFFPDIVKCCMIKLSKYFSLYSFATPRYHLYDSFSHVNGVAIMFAQHIITQRRTWDRLLQTVAKEMKHRNMCTV